MKLLKAGIRLAVLPVAIAFAVIAGGCTRNNGSIGDWFGTWQLTEICTDGVPDEGYEGNIFWKFQNCVICMVRVDTAPGANEREEVCGTWEETDGTLLLEFSYSDERNPVSAGESGMGIYAPFEETHIPYGVVSELVIERGTGREKTFRYFSPDGVTYTYTIRKQ